MTLNRRSRKTLFAAMKPMKYGRIAIRSTNDQKLIAEPTDKPTVFRILASRIDPGAVFQAEDRDEEGLKVVEYRRVAISDRCFGLDDCDERGQHNQ